MLQGDGFEAAFEGLPHFAGLLEGCATLFSELVPQTGAVAAAMGECNPPRVRSVWKCEETEASRVLSHPSLEKREDTPSGLLVSLGSQGFFTEEGLRVDAVRAIPIRPADGPTVLLLLFYPPALVPDEAQVERAESLALLGTFLLERDYYADEARRAREARDHFLVAIHHELRTPATAVMIETGLLQSGLLGPLTPRLQGSLTRLEGQLAELVRVVQRVLDLARLETAVEPARNDLVDPREAVVALARHLEPAAKRKGVSLALFFPRGLSVLQTDGERFRRVVLYLLTNAVKYTEQGHIQVRVERKTRSLAEHRRESLLVVRVVDTGRGIPKAELERIFEPFAQVEEGARSDSQTRGIGLGLSLALKLARSLGGDVTVESVPGKGTTATFSVPYGGAAAP